MLMKCVCGWSLAVWNNMFSLLMPSMLRGSWKAIRTPAARRNCSVFNRLSHVGMRTWQGAHPEKTKLFKTGLGSAWSDGWLQPVGQGGQHLVKLSVSQSLALLSSPAPPQQPHLEVSQEELQDLRLLLETCNITSPYQCISSRVCSQ